MAAAKPKTFIRFIPNKDDQLRLNNAHYRIEEGIKKGIFIGMELILKSAKRFDGANQLKIRTGSLRDSLEISVKKEGGNWVGFLGSDSPYAAIHEYGGVIQARFAEWLVFSTDSGVKKVSQVTIPPRPFLRPAIERNKDSVANLLKESIYSYWKGRILGVFH